MEPVSVATKGIESLFDYGAAITVLVVVLIAAGVLVRYLLTRCDLRFEQSLQKHEALTEKVNGVVEKNTTAFLDLSNQIKNLK